MPFDRNRIRFNGLLTLLTVSFALLFGRVFVTLAEDWATDGNYSHGFLIVPLAAYLVWERRHCLRAAPSSPSVFGLLVVTLSLLMLLAGVLGAELFLPRLAMVGTVAGAVWFLWGGRHLRIVAFPLAVLLLMIPIPNILFNQIAFPLQLVASQVGQAGLTTLGIPVLREGNIIVLANTSLEVAEACSGIRSLVSLCTLGVFYGYFTDPRASVRTFIALSTVPVAILANGLRVAGTGVAAHYYGPSAAEGFFHTFSGWLVFAAAFMFLFVIMRAVLWLMPLSGDTRVPVEAV